jgi:hypothetical protein
LKNFLTIPGGKKYAYGWNKTFPLGLEIEFFQ